jgi:hypothetical protein
MKPSINLNKYIRISSFTSRNQSTPRLLGYFNVIGPDFTMVIRGDNIKTENTLSL